MTDQIRDLQRRNRILEARLIRAVADQRMLEAHKDTHEALLRKVIVQMEATEVRLRESEAAAREASKAKSEFLANMSHEIRTPLAGILSLVDLLRSTSLDPRQGRMVDNLSRSAQVLLQIIDDTLDFSKIEAGRLTLERTSFDLRDAVEDAVAIVADRARARGLDLTCAVRVDEVVDGDPTRFRQVLLNLLSNAIKFTERGAVDVVVSEELGGATRALRVAVSDTGIGVPEAVREAIFEPFRQADGSTTRRFGGTGLGLAIAREIAEAHGGSLTCEDHAGAGATFALRLPAPVPRPSPPRRSVLGGCRVGLCIANPRQREAVALQLRALNATPVDIEEAGGALSVDVLVCERPKTHSDWGRGLPQVRLAAPGEGAQVPTEDLPSLTRPPRSADLESACVEAIWGRDGRINRGDPRGTYAGAEAITVLLAEDNQINREVTEALLRETGVQVRAVSDGLEALRVALHEPFQLILLDIHMPGADGFEIAQHLRAAEGPNRETPIVALTANVVRQDRDRCRTAGMDDFLGKPFAYGDLVGLLQTWAGLGQPAILDQLAWRSLLELAGLHVRGLLDTFTVDGRRLISELDAALRDEDLERAWRLAHTIKGMALQLGALRLGAAAERLEQALHQGVPPSSRLVMPLAGLLSASAEAMARALEPMEHPG